MIGWVTFITLQPKAIGRTRKKLDIILPKDLQPKDSSISQSRNKWQQLPQGIIQHVPELIVLKVDLGKLKAEIKTEQAPNGDWYPHLYGILNLDAVENVISLQAEPDGTFRFEGN